MTAVGDARKRAAEAMHDADGPNTGPDAETVPDEPCSCGGRERWAAEIEARADYIQNGASPLYTRALRDAAKIVRAGSIVLSTEADHD